MLSVEVIFRDLTQGILHLTSEIITQEYVSPNKQSED
jgi:hypothetical protein